MSAPASVLPPTRASRNARVALLLVVAAAVAAFFVFDLGRYLRLESLKANRLL